MASPGATRAIVALGLLTAVLVPGACGFHPRGSLVALDEPGRLFVDADRGLSIEEALREALSGRAFPLAANRDEADVVLRITDERQTRRILSVRSTGRVSEFQLVHAVSVAIARSGEGAGDGAIGGTGGADAPAPVAPRADRVEVTREYTYDERQVLGKENEARILRGEMEDELVRQIVLRTVASLARTAAEGPG